MWAPWGDLLYFRIHNVLGFTRVSWAVACVSQNIPASFGLAASAHPAREPTVVSHLFWVSLLLNEFALYSGKGCSFQSLLDFGVTDNRLHACLG